MAAKEGVHPLRTRFGRPRKDCTKIFNPLSRCRIVQRVLQRGVQLRDDLFRRVARNDEGIPSENVEGWQTSLVGTSYIRCGRNPAGLRYDQRAHIACHYLRNHVGSGIAHAIDLSADQIIDGWARSSIGNVLELHLGEVLKEKARTRDLRCRS